MGMSMTLQFFRSPDDADLLKKLEAAYACRLANVAMPPDLVDFLAPVIAEFGELPKDKARAVDALLSLGPEWKEQEAYVWKDDMQEGFEIDLDKLPKGTKRVRFYCSW